MTDFVPRNDILFAAWAQQFSGYAGNHMADIGLVQADVDALDAIATTWQTKFTTHQNKQVEAKGARDIKNSTRTEFEAFIRPLVARIQACPTTTDADRQGLGITVRGANAPIVGAGGMEMDRPLALIDGGNRLRHTVRIHNQTATGTGRAKPPGTLGCEILVKVGDAPTGIQDMKMIGLATRSPYIVEFADEDGGKMAHYALRWVSKKGEKGPWSETESATIAA